MSSLSSGALAVVHLRYTDVRARRDVIVGRLPRLSSNVPPRTWYFADIPSGLEVAVLHGRSDPAASRDLDKWVGDTSASGLIVSSTRVSTSFVLDPELFLGGAVPAFFPAAAARHSARASALLRDPVVDVRAEIDAIFAELVDAGDRDRALDLYASWLEHVATDETPPAAGVPPEWALRASYVARLAHTQVVRLQGPESGGGLQREAALVRTLLSS